MLTSQRDPRAVRAGAIQALVLSGRPGATRAAALQATLCGAELRIVTPTALPELDGVDAIVLDGSMRGLSADDVGRLRRRVEAGAALVAVGTAAHVEQGEPLCELLGAHADPGSVPVGEVFLGAVAGNPLTDRLDPESPIVDSLDLLTSQDSEATTVLSVRLRGRDRPVALDRRLGDGHVLVTGVGNLDGALRHPTLAAVLRRALRRAAPVRAASTLGVGIIGYGQFGGMGYTHGIATEAVDGLRLVAVCDTSAERRRAAAADFPGLRTHAAAGALANDPDVEVVVIATPPPLHASLAMRMLHAGKHVVCEKPLCLRVDEADDLIAAAADRDLALTVNQNRRDDTDFIALRDAVEAGLLGEVFNVETFVGGFEHPCRAWHSDAALSGGAVHDWGAHHVDWILELMPAYPATVTTTAHKRVWHDVTNHDQIRVRMHWDDGREAQFLHSDIAAVRPPKFFVQGTEGTLAGHYRPLAFERLEPGRGYVREVAHHAEAPVELLLRRYISGQGLIETLLPLAPERRFAFHRNLADHLLLGEPLAVSPESVRRVVGVLEAAGRSADQGGTPVPLRNL